MVILQPFSTATSSAPSSIATPNLNPDLFRHPWTLISGLACGYLVKLGFQLFKLLPFFVEIFKDQQAYFFS
jgi:hypothetical protein